MSMATRHEITKKYAKDYERASKKDRGRVLDELVAVAGWSRANARRAIATPAVRRKTRAPTFGDDTLKVLVDMCTLGRGAVREVPGADHGPHLGSAGGLR